MSSRSSCVEKVSGGGAWVMGFLAVDGCGKERWRGA